MAESEGKVADTYGLPRDQAESARLNAQHLLFKQNLGWLIHPNIAERLPHGAHIADVGAGTATWLLDVADDLADRQFKLTALDMNDAQFPKQRPHGVAFDTLNILEPIPDKYKAQFDLVHLRLLVCGLPTGLWQTAAGNVLQLLKPGGWVQNLTALQTELGKRPVASDEIQRRLCMETGIKMGMGWDDAKQVDKFFETAGFQCVTADVYASDRNPSVRGLAAPAGMGAYAGMMKLFGKAEGDDSFWLSAEAEQLLQKAIKETSEDGCYMRVPMLIYSGQRPL